MLGVSVHPIWFYFNLALVTYEILLSCLHFLSQSWLMAFKVKIIGLHQGCFITLVRKECERLENESKQKECITLVFEKDQPFACVSLCIFIAGASLTVHDITDMRSRGLCILHQTAHGSSTAPHTTREGRTSPGQPGTAGKPESKSSNKPSLWDSEVKAGQGANCHWSLNDLFRKTPPACAFPPPHFPEKCVQL